MLVKVINLLTKTRFSAVVVALTVLCKDDEEGAGMPFIDVKAAFM